MNRKPADGHNDVDVLVVGAGPTGLLLAGELAEAGLSTTLVERRDTESNLTRAFAVHARSLELLDARGLADELVEGGRTVDTVRLFGRVDVHLGRLASRFPFVLVTPQYETERVLRRRAGSVGVRIRRSTELVSLEQDATGVVATLRPRDGREYTVRASYLVGADGVRSTVRHELGLPFAGRSAVMRSLILADVQLSQAPEALFTVDGTGDGFAFVAPFGDGWYRVIAWNRHRQLPDDAPVSLDEVREITRRVLGTDYGMHDARWLSRFHNDERQVPHYRVGRAFLVGDAAHAHSPAGGQGMNTGLQDAFNLGWKLAAVVRGQAGGGLLDTYHTERHPVGQRVVRLTGALARGVVLRYAPLRAVRDLAAGLALRMPRVADAVAGAVSGIAIGYRGPRGGGGSAGSRAPDMPLTGENGSVRLYEALRGGHFVLVVPEGEQDVAADLASPWTDRVRVAASSSQSSRVLVRPDGYVAWTGPRPADPVHGHDEIRAALDAWCGAPSLPRGERSTGSRPVG